MAVTITPFASSLESNPVYDSGRTHPYHPKAPAPQSRYHLAIWARRTRSTGWGDEASEIDGYLHLRPLFRRLKAVPDHCDSGATRTPAGRINGQAVAISTPLTLRPDGAVAADRIDL